MKKRKKKKNLHYISHKQQPVFIKTSSLLKSFAYSHFKLKIPQEDVTIEKFETLKLSLRDIVLGTKNFRDRIGTGGYGTVYKGELIISGKPTKVAVKRLNKQFGQGSKEFLTEIHLCSDQKHPNLISLIGYCDEGNEKLIVYEYADRGSLDKYLRRSNTTRTLTWMERLKICVDAASGLNYLHNHAGEHQTIIHWDIKSANILIDGNWVGKVSDLGLSKLSFRGLNKSDVVSHACGTPGYCEPQYFETNSVTKESDVYSFGMVLFEVLCGMLCTIVNDNGLVLSSSSAKYYYEKKKLEEIVDPSLKGEISLDSMNRFAAIAYGCLHFDRRRRPSMGLVVKELEKSLKLQESSIHVVLGLKEKNPTLSKWGRYEKVWEIFQQFDENDDGGLNKKELTALIVAANPKLRDSERDILTCLNDLYYLYGRYFDGKRGLSFDGLLLSYDQGNIDLDFNIHRTRVELNREIQDQVTSRPEWIMERNLKGGNSWLMEKCTNSDGSLHWWLKVLIGVVVVVYLRV